MFFFSFSVLSLSHHPHPQVKMKIQQKFKSEMKVNLLQVNLCQKHLLFKPTIWQKIVHWFTNSVHENYKIITCCVNKLFLFWHSEQFMYTTYSELVVFMYWTGKPMNHLLSYCGLVDVRINTSDKDLPVLQITEVASIAPALDCTARGLFHLPT